MPRATDAPPRRARPSPEALFAVLAPLLSGGLSLWLGGDLNYDLRHYHYYNGYALTNGRFDYDFAPAGIQSFLNPLQDAFYYLGIRHLPPRLFGFLLGALHGLNAVLVHLVARRALALDPWGRWLALLAGALALFGSNALSLVGTTCGDNLVSLPLLAALWLVLEHDQPPPGRLLAAGFAAGIAGGMKLTMLAPGVALGVALLATLRPAAGIFRFGLGSLLGFLAASGFWSWRLLERFSSPVFPILNGVFRSPFFRPDSVIDARFAAHAWWEAATLPLEMALGWTSGLQEIRFQEPRFLLVLLAALAWLLARAWGPRQVLAGNAPRQLVVFWLGGFGLWVYGLHYFRYATVLELLAPAVAFVLLRRTPWGRAPVLAAVALLVLVGARPVNWGRFPWGGDWFQVRLPPLSRLEESLVIVAGERVSYALPSFPEKTRFVGLTARGSPWLDGLLIGKLGAQAGPILLLPGVGATPREAERFGLAADGDCLKIETRDGGLCLYELRRR